MAFIETGIRMQVSMFSRRWMSFNENIIVCRSLSSMRPVSIISKAGNTVKPVDAIPGPTRLPFFGSFWSFVLEGLLPGAKPLGKRFLDLQARFVKKYGKIYRVQLPGMDIVVAADPEDVGMVYRNEGKYPKRFDSPILNFYRESRKKIPGVFFANDEEWHKYRSVISKRMLRPKEIADYAPVLNEIITDFISRLREIHYPVGTERENEVLHLDNELFKWSFESVTQVLFDRRFGSLREQMNPEAQEFISSVGQLLNSILNVTFIPVGVYKIYETKDYKTFYSSFDKMYEIAEIFIDRRIDELRQKAKINNGSQDNTVSFFEFLLASGKLTEDDLLASVIDLMFAGVDTTSNAMLWILYLLAKNPDKQEKLHQEVSSVLGPRRQADADTLAQMPYLKACVRETLRIYPVVPSMSRTLGVDLVIQGYNVPAGTQIEFPFYYMSRSEEIFPEASSFKPERWLRDASKSTHIETNSAFASIPFGFGTRMCVGRRIAEMEMHLLLSRLVQQFWMTYPQGEEVEPTMRGVTITDREVRVKFEEREIK